ncbi:hypothetical protein GCM10023184_02460 [Flaviaesturariibacter amylovorans]|uniref:Uncharacterized protein n=1 Tax=Flaviaesturariibacter amylovorans TaxID=1084520 RepID=A0ABP8G711_9BACT
MAFRKAGRGAQVEDPEAGALFHLFGSYLRFEVPGGLRGGGSGKQEGKEQKEAKRHGNAFFFREAAKRPGAAPPINAGAHPKIVVPPGNGCPPLTFDRKGMVFPFSNCL